MPQSEVKFNSLNSETHGAKALLQEILILLNHLPRRRYPGARFTDSYQLAAEVDRVLASKEPPP